MNEIRIYADFGNADRKGRVRLNCNGTLEDLAQQKIQLSPGLVLTLYSDDANEAGDPDDLQTTGIAEYSVDEQMWVAVIDWAAIHHVSEERKHSAHQPPARNVG